MTFVIGLTALVAAGGISTPSERPAPILHWPIECQIGVSCEIQNYVDRDPTVTARDYRCGSRTYDGHTGTDIRVQDLRAEASVAVLAAADGQVLRIRDGVPDINVRAIGEAAVRGHECGNAVVIGHGDGWATMYCHMAKGSVRVKPGQRLRAGESIGRPGLSGDTEFPHLHFEVRHNGRLVDPFAPGAPAGTTCGGGAPLWDGEVQKEATYRLRAILNAGFVSLPISAADVESGRVKDIAPTAAAGFLIAYVRALGLQAGDVQKMELADPAGAVLFSQSAAPIDHDKAQFFQMFGTRRKPAGWRRGTYTATYSVMHDSKTILVKRFSVTL